jgi:hypothetical protein
VRHLFINNVSLNDNPLCPRPRFLKRAPYTCEPLRCKTYDPEQVVALHRVNYRVNKLVRECVWGGCIRYCTNIFAIVAPSLTKKTQS